MFFYSLFFLHASCRISLLISILVKARGVRVEELRVQKDQKQIANAIRDVTRTFRTLHWHQAPDPGLAPVACAAQGTGWAGAPPPRSWQIQEFSGTQEGQLCLRGCFPGNRLTLLLGEGQCCLFARISQNSCERVRCGRCRGALLLRLERLPGRHESLSSGSLPLPSAGRRKKQA